MVGGISCFCPKCSVFVGLQLYTNNYTEQAVQMLTGLERFVRLVVERESLVPRSAAPPSLNTSQDKSPKVFTLLIIFKLHCDICGFRALFF